ncbi:MAG: rhodanese-like domain-containing protein [Planctomycetota bacterium]
MLRTLLRTVLVCSGLIASGCLDNSGRRAPSTPERNAQVLQLYRDYQAEAFEGVADVSVNDLKSQSGSRALVLVDCREPEEREISVIPGAISREEFDADRERYRDHWIVPYCTIGYRSGVYTRDLVQNGFEAANLIGGVLSWAHEGGTFVSPAGTSTHDVHVYGPTWNLLPDGYRPFWDGEARP